MGSYNLPFDVAVLAHDHDAVLAAAGAVAEGKIVAIKGIGGFQLIVDARNDAAVRRLRERKGREEKPFAVMYPSIDAVAADCVVSDAERQLLTSPQAPIVLLEYRGGSIAPSVAPGNPDLGVMLPYTPMHHLLLGEMGFPVVATSGNLSDEPICIDERDALQRLPAIADLFLVHNRPIARHVDDSVVRIVCGRELVMRRARGYAPLPVLLRVDLPPILAFGAHQKCAAALSVGRQVIVSQHIGDQGTLAANAALARTLADLPHLYDLTPLVVACDLHPDYASTVQAESYCATEPPAWSASMLSTASTPSTMSTMSTGFAKTIIHVQHHYAHVLSCMAENEIAGPVLGVAWDGTGLGADGTIWGGEFLVVDGFDGFVRAGHLRTFALPGGDQAVKEPRRTALAVLLDVYGDAAYDMMSLAPVADFTVPERLLIATMIARGLNSPVTSSMGRLFDAVAAIVGLRQRTAYEGQAAMMLEQAARRHPTEVRYKFDITIEVPACAAPVCVNQRTLTSAHLLREGMLVADWRPVIRAIIDDLAAGATASEVAARFHNGVVEMLVEMVALLGIERVALTGGCFQNKYLTERAVRRLTDAGFRPYRHQRIPPNDGGIALGQIVGAARQLKSDPTIIGARKRGETVCV